MRIGESIRNMVKNWLQIQPAQGSSINITESLSYEATCLRDRIIYRGESSEIEQFFKQANTNSNETVSGGRFWAAVPSKGLAIRKIHSGIPGEVIDIFSDIVVSDMLEPDFDDMNQKKRWEQISSENENDFTKTIGKSISEVLAVGDGAFKISFDNEVSKFPIIEFFSGDEVEYKYKRGRIVEYRFKFNKEYKNKRYKLVEIYGKGFVNYELYDYKDNLVSLDTIPELANLKPITFDSEVILAVQLKFFSSSKWAGRGRSLFDRKIDAIDSLDETISQWQDALRLGRTKRYIPRSMIPVNPRTGEELSPNPFDNQYIAIRSSKTEGETEKIITETPDIEYEAFLATYINNLDMLLQGIISPSTLGIDIKKLDNAEAQREKEKVTLYTRNKLVYTLDKVIPELIKVTLIADATYNNRFDKNEKYNITFGFGEYANPSFEAQVETLGKASSSNLMSIETQVEELWGDTKDEEWKAKEVARIKAEKGIVDGGEEPPPEVM